MRFVISFLYALASNALKLSAADGTHTHTETHRHTHTDRRSSGKATQRNRDAPSTHAHGQTDGQSETKRQLLMAAAVYSALS